MVWLVVAVGWVLISAPAALLFGATARAAERRERAYQVPDHVPDGWVLTLSR
jgi:hypothetical protein